MGMIYWGSRLASKMPSLVNTVTHTPGLSTLAKRIAGIHPNRTIPKFATQTFKKWFFSKPSHHNTNPKPDIRPVILWADTFNNYFRPETAIAATKVLEDAGFTVKVYERSMCCGRPLYDWGMLDRAKRHLQDILKIVDRDISAGIPMVVLEPSCASVFRDELNSMFSKREDAKRLSESTYLLSEFLEKFAPEYCASNDQQVTNNENSNTHSLLHLHCHHHSVLGRDEEGAVLKRAGIGVEQVDAGCCGMAGAFGFEEEHYDISMQIGERKLLPKIRQTSKDHLIIADGFSCREQIEQTTGRKTYHLAEVLAMKKVQK
jgi:Fe-S oxidoreductase